jgi:hypothetical protein
MATCNLVLDMSGVVRRMNAAKPAVYGIVFAYECGFINDATYGRYISSITKWAAKAAFIRGYQPDGH